MDAEPGPLAGEAQLWLLLVFLETAVPMWVSAAATWPAERLSREAREATSVLAHGAAALAGPAGAPPGPGVECSTAQDPAAGLSRAAVYDAIAKSLALGALAPGGVSWLGRHWCAAPHGTCPGMIPAAWLPGPAAPQLAAHCQ